MYISINLFVCVNGKGKINWFGFLTMKLTTMSHRIKILEVIHLLQEIDGSHVRKLIQELYCLFTERGGIISKQLNSIFCMKLWPKYKGK